MSSLMKGTAILTIGLFLSKILGLVYVFPFYAIVGDENLALYQYAYVPYNIMLSIAIAGLPIAISKMVSRYNALGDYAAGRKLIKSSMWLMIATGVLSFLIMNLLATPIAKIVIADDDQVFSVEQVATVLRWVSFALLVVPAMSALRGFFQGYGIYHPTSVSQLVEQIARIIVLLGGAFVVVVLMDGSPITAVNFAVFAAFIGSIGSFYMLYRYWRKLKPEFDEKLAISVSSGPFKPATEMKQLLIYAIPVIFVGLGNSLYQLVDMITFNRTMSAIGLAEVTDALFSMLNFLTHKVVMIPVMLATGFSMALVPTITKMYTQGDMLEVRESLDKTYQVLLFITIPAAVGITILAPEIYHTLYSQSEQGASVLAHYAPVAILFALFSVTAAILQGIEYQKVIIFSLLTGVLVKLILNIPLIRLMEVDGAILATALGYMVTIAINIIVINKVLNYHSTMVKRRILLIVILTAVMAAAVLAVKWLMGLVWTVDTKLMAILFSFVGVAVGGAVYGFISFRVGLGQKLLGARVTRIAAKFGFK